MERLERDHELRRRAVRIGDDAALAEARERIGVDLRDHQGHVGIVAPARRIIDHHRALGRDPRRVLLGHRRARRHQADVDVGEIVVVERFAFERPVAEGHVHAHALARGERNDFVGRERPFGQNPQHLAAHIAGGADDGDLETHGESPKKPARCGATAWGGRRVLMGNRRVIQREAGAPGRITRLLGRS